MCELLKWPLSFKISIAFYALSMFMPITYREMGSRWGSEAFDRAITITGEAPQLRDTDGYVIGFECFIWSFLIFKTFRWVFFSLGAWTWAANPLLWLSWLTLPGRKGRLSACFALGSFVFAVAAGLYFLHVQRTGFPLHIAYFCWLASIGFQLLAASAKLTLDSRSKSPPQPVLDSTAIQRR